MKIINKTNYAVTTSTGNIILTNESVFETENIFNTLSLHSEIGSCIITTEYSCRSFKNFGKIVVYEDEKSTSPNDPKKDIIISEV